MESLNKFLFLLFAKMIYCATISSAIAQPANIFNRNHLSLVVGATTADAAVVTPRTGLPLLKTSAAYGGRVAMRYSINFNKYISFETGIEISTQAHAWNFRLDSANAGLISWEELQQNTRSPISHVEIPFLLSIHALVNRKLWAYGQSGFAIAQHDRSPHTTFVAYSPEDSTGLLGGYEVFTLKTKRNGFDGIRFPVAIGLLIPLRNEAAIRIGYHASYVLDDMLIGQYTFKTFPIQGNNQVSQVIATGTYRFRGSYQGIELGYVFTGRKTFKRSPKE